MNPRRLPLVFLVLFGVAFGSLWVVRSLSMKPPKESELIERFRAHRPVYERLRDMLLEDKDLKQVFVDYGVAVANSPVVNKPSDVNFPTNRYNEYVSLLHQIGSNAVFKGGDSEPELVCVGIWGAGWAGHTRHVWICSTQRPSTQVENLDAYYLDSNRPRNVFRHIDNDWYLRADW